MLFKGISTLFFKSKPVSNTKHWGVVFDVMPLIFSHAEHVKIQEGFAELLFEFSRTAYRDRMLFKSSDFINKKLTELPDIDYGDTEKLDKTLAFTKIKEWALLAYLNKMNPYIGFSNFKEMNEKVLKLHNDSISFKQLKESFCSSGPNARRIEKIHNAGGRVAIYPSAPGLIPLSKHMLSLHGLSARDIDNIATIQNSGGWFDSKSDGLREVQLKFDIQEPRNLVLADFDDSAIRDTLELMPEIRAIDMVDDYMLDHFITVHEKESQKNQSCLKLS